MSEAKPEGENTTPQSPAVTAPLTRGAIGTQSFFVCFFVLQQLLQQLCDIAEVKTFLFLAEQELCQIADIRVLKQ